MSVNSKMTAIADNIRELSDVSGKLGLDAMATKLQEANADVNTQTNLISQITSSLNGKAISAPIQKASGTFVTNSEGGFDISLPFFPDLVLIHANETSEGHAYHVGLCYGEDKRVGNSVYATLATDTGYGYFMYTTAHDGGVGGAVYHVDDNSNWTVTSTTFYYTAIKYT